MTSPAIKTRAIKVNVGCGPNILDGYVNIDVVPKHETVQEGSLTALPFADDSVDEILAEHIFEHLSFEEEPAAWNECARVLRAGGKLIMEVPDFEWVCRTFLDAKDEFREFYRTGSLDHYFGNGRALDQRWSIVTTMFFGNQNGAGQYHKTAYTLGKIEAIAALKGFTTADVKLYDNKGGQAIRATLIKN